MVDPGLHSAGWAVFSQIPNNPFPQKAGLVKAKYALRDSDVLVRANYIGEELALVCQENNCTDAIIEFPMNFKGAKGLAANASGDVIALATCVGAIAGNLHQVGVKSTSIRVIDWKGQLPKEIVIKRLATLLGPAMCARLRLEKDMWDACGIGMHYKGYF